MNIKQMEQHLSDRIGAPVEITIRGENEFTFSIESNVAEHADTMVKWFSHVAQPKKVDIQYDEELNTQFVYIEI